MSIPDESEHMSKSLFPILGYRFSAFHFVPTSRLLSKNNLKQLFNLNNNLQVLQIFVLNSDINLLIFTYPF